MNIAPSRMVSTRAILAPLRSPGLQGVVRPGDRGAREQQGQGVDQREVPGRDGLDARAAARCAQAVRTSSMDESVRCPWKSAISKKIQNQATKNITSEAMNMIMP